MSRLQTCLDDVQQQLFLSRDAPLEVRSDADHNHVRIVLAADRPWVLQKRTRRVRESLCTDCWWKVGGYRTAELESRSPRRSNYLFSSHRAVPAGQIESLWVNFYAKKHFPAPPRDHFLFPHRQKAIIKGGIKAQQYGMPLPLLTAAPSNSAAFCIRAMTAKSSKVALMTSHSLCSWACSADVKSSEMRPSSASDLLQSLLAFHFKTRPGVSIQTCNVIYSNQSFRAVSFMPQEPSAGVAEGGIGSSRSRRHTFPRRAASRVYQLGFRV